ncbi:MAG: hypothetical protein ACXVCP_11105 [Bdellovibrio sp.]
MKILKFSGRAKPGKLVERSTGCSAIELNKSLDFAAPFAPLGFNFIDLNG